VSVPLLQGYKKTLKENWFKYENLQFGIYRIKIISNNKHFNNMFIYCKDNHYISTTIKYLYGCKDKYEIKFELLQPDEVYDYNAYVYSENKDDFKDGKTVFKKWFDEMQQLYKAFPDNKIVKNLMTTLWGQLSAFNKEYIKEDFSEHSISHRYSNKETDYKILKSMDNGDYQIINTNDAYKFPLARIKPFLTSNARLKMFKLIEKNQLEENIVRIHTDCISLNKPYEFIKKKKDDYVPIPENKTTGYINWKNALHGYHICEKCNQEFKYKLYIEHIKNC
jgi:hypothetical protein